MTLRTRVIGSIGMTLRGTPCVSRPSPRQVPTRPSSRSDHPPDPTTGPYRARWLLPEKKPGLASIALDKNYCQGVPWAHG